ncbi:MAG: TonB-dependent receptor [Acidaminococcales bacterium]|jgi:outer membrane cobalamin receptor|nr:TonB-dependent receptor [Acidaminococcales bacterium]
MRKSKKVLGMGVFLSLSLLQGSALAKENAAEEVFELDPVTVTATRTKRRPLDIAAETAVITADDIERKGAISLADALEGAPGVAVVRYGRTGAATPFINGSEIVVVMIDGVRINPTQGTSGASSIDLSQFAISLDAIERIEVARGGNSALYGADAVGGVIQIFTKKGTREPSANFGIAIGDDRQREIRLGTSGSNGKWDWRLNGVYYATDGYRPNSRDDDKNLSLRIGRQAGGGDLFFNYNYIRHKAGEPGTITSPSLFDRSEAENQILSIGYNKSDFRLQYYYKDRDYKGLSYSTRFAHKEKTHGLSYQDSRKIGNNLLSWGTDLSVAEIESTNYEGQRKRWKRNFFLQDQVGIGKFILTPSLLYEMTNDFGNKAVPKISGLYKINDKTSFFANWGKVFRAPDFDDLYWYEDWGSGMGMFGNPNLKPETGWTFETGLKKEFGDKHSVSVSFFRRLLKDRIVWQDVSGGYGTLWTPQNISSYQANGAAVTWTGVLGNHFRADVNYTYIDSDASDYYSERRNQFHLGLHYANRKYSQSVMIDSLSANDQNQYPSQNLPGHAVVNTTARYQIAENQKVYLNIYNLLDHKYHYRTGYPANGISFLVGWEIKFR